MRIFVIKLAWTGLMGGLAADSAQSLHGAWQGLVIGACVGAATWAGRVTWPEKEEK